MFSDHHHAEDCPLLREDGDSGDGDGDFGDALEEQEDLPGPGTRGYISYASGLALRSKGVLPTPVTSTPRNGRNARRRW